jgi:uncharacterized membrane protein
MVNYRSRLVTIMLTLLIAGYVIFFTTQLFLHYYSFGSRALDLGNMGQAIWNTSQGRLFHQTNQPGLTNRLSLHVEPILVPISLLYHVYSGPETLFIVQTVVVALGAIPVFALARLKLNNDGLALIFALVYLMFPAIQAANLLDFHAVTLAPTFFLTAFYYLETRRLKLFALFAVLTAACKEDMTLLVMMLGFYAFLINRQRRVGLATVALSGLWVSLAVFVIPPLFAGTDNIHWNRYDHLGEGALNIVMNVFLQPHLFLDHLQNVNAANYLRLLLTPSGFTALFNPITLLLALPSLGINLLSNFPPMQRANSLIYAAPIVPAIMISSIYGLANIKRFVWHGSWVMGHGATLSSFFNMALGSLILFATSAYHYHYGYLPGGGQYRGWEEVTDHHRRAATIVAQIPDDAALSAQDRLDPHLSRRETLYIFDRIDDADHIVLDVTEDSWPLHPVELRHRVDRFLNDEGFGIVDALDGYLLLAKNDRTGGQPDLPTNLPDRFFDFARVDQPASFQPDIPVSITFDDKLELLGYALGLGAHEEFLPVVTLYWRALQPLAENYTLWPFFIDRNGHLIEDPSERPLVTTLWYPTSRWSPAEIIQTPTLPRDLGDEFTLAVGVAEGKWTNPAERLQIMQADKDIYIFENQTWARLGTFQRTGRKSYEAIAIAPSQPQQTRRIQFWNTINLAGIDVPTTPLEPGDDLPLTLYWEATSPVTLDLTTFAHLVNDGNNVVAQLDWIPQDTLGYLPTTAWQPHRPVIDHQTIPLPADIAPGQYRLVIGWYYPPTGDRLPLTATDTPNSGSDVVETGVVRIE